LAYIIVVILTLLLIHTSLQILLALLDDGRWKILLQNARVSLQNNMAFYPTHDLYNTEDQSSYTVSLNLIEVNGQVGFLIHFGP